MLSLLHSLKKLLLSFKTILKNEDARALSLLIAALLLIGTLFYSVVEKMHIVDALYFAVITLTTIGYGDLYPITTVGKIFTIFYVFVGLGVMAIFISVVAKGFIYMNHKNHVNHKKHKTEKKLQLQNKRNPN